MDISVVVPVYNEADNIGPLYRRLAKVMQGLSNDYEIIFVDDGSIDPSFDVLKSLARDFKRLKIISFDKNYGQHPAVIAGFNDARGAFVITLDADLQNPPEEIPKVFDEIKKGYKMVAGRRMHRKDGFMRRSGSFFTNLLIFMLTGVKMGDYGTMLRAFRGDFAKEVARQYEKQRLYIPVLVSKITKDIAEVDIHHDDRFSGTSKYSFTELFKILFFIMLRYFSGFYGFLQDIGLAKGNGKIYKIKCKIENGEEKTVG